MWDVTDLLSWLEKSPLLLCPSPKSEKGCKTNIPLVLEGGSIFSITKNR
jgi:hypothetical protein